MKTIPKPEMTPLALGQSTKAIQVIASSGMEIPLHHSTAETAIIVQEGQALLQMAEAEHMLQAGSVFIIPANIDHSLSVHLNFKAVAVMAAEGTINFKK